jgi:hypothetical protein
LGDGKTALTRLGPNKMPLMQSALTQPHAIAIPQQDFDTITDCVAKHKGRSGRGLLSQGLLHQCRQTIDSPAKINWGYA